MARTSQLTLQSCMAQSKYEAVIVWQAPVRTACLFIAQFLSVMRNVSDECAIACKWRRSLMHFLHAARHAGMPGWWHALQMLTEYDQTCNPDEQHCRVRRCKMTSLHFPLSIAVRQSSQLSQVQRMLSLVCNALLGT